LRKEAVRSNFEISKKNLANLCGQDIVQKASSSEMIKAVHGSLAKPCIVVINCEDLAL
jgi:hypothetical protein